MSTESAVPHPRSPEDRSLSVTERDMLGAIELLTTASADPAVTAVLTDEEILGLDGQEALEILGSPYLSNDAVDRESAAASAVRSLIARGLVNPTPENRENEGAMVIGTGDPSQRVIQLDRALAGLTTLRRIPEAMVIAVRTTDIATTTLGIHLFPEDGVLEEFVASDGLHHFTIPVRDAVAGRLADFVDPHGAAAADGDSREVALGDLASLPELQDARTVTSLSFLGRGEGRQVTIFALGDRVIVADQGDPAVAATEDDVSADQQPMEICEVSGQTLRNLLVDVLPVVDDEEPETAG